MADQPYPLFRQKDSCPGITAAGRAPTDNIPYTFMPYAFQVLKHALRIQHTKGAVNDIHSSFVCSFNIMPAVGLEPARGCPRQIFESDASAIPPRRQSCDRISPSRSRTIYHIIPSFILQPHFFTFHTSLLFLISLTKLSYMITL